MIQANSSLRKALDHRKYYRMPWTVTDNAMSWLEVTTKCNITCRGCYRDPRKDGHKSLDQIRQELEVFQDHRVETIHPEDDDATELSWSFRTLL